MSKIQSGKSEDERERFLRAMEEKRGGDDRDALRWVGSNPIMDAYLYNTSLIGRIRARLPSWLGGKPLIALASATVSSGHLSTVQTDTLDLGTQLYLARGAGRRKEVAKILARIDAAKEASAGIKRVA